METTSVSGYSRRGMMDTHNVSGCRGTEVLDTQNVSDYRRTEVLERQCEDTNPRKMTADGSRHTSDTSQQPSAYGDQASIMKEMFEMLKKMDNKITNEMFEMLKKMDNKITALPGKVIEGQPQEKEENEVLKEKIKKLEARYQELLAKAIAMHSHSEDINDPLRLSAVLVRYEMLQLQEWEKVRSSYRWTYEEGSCTIKKLFDACEKDIQQRTADILKGLDIPPSNDAMTKSQQVMMREIRKLFRQHHYQNYSSVYNKIVQEAGIHTGTENETHFLLQCCQIFCLLLLQDPPVKAEWNMNRRSYLEHVEHVDKKAAVNWKKPALLWPIMKQGEEIIAKGVVWD